jgi:hypothetical protein
VELGGEVIDETGGNGSPPGTFTDRVIDLFPIFDLPLLEMLYRGYGNLRFSNKLVGVDARVRVLSLAGWSFTPRSRSTTRTSAVCAAPCWRTGASTAA